MMEFSFFVGLLASATTLIVRIHAYGVEQALLSMVLDLGVRVAKARNDFLAGVVRTPR
ncbi:MAG TPA: hypothetical protein VIB79_08630 [Candidatus Binatia bacterium]